MTVRAQNEFCQKISQIIGTQPRIKSPRVDEHVKAPKEISKILDRMRRTNRCIQQEHCPQLR